MLQSIAVTEKKANIPKEFAIRVLGRSHPRGSVGKQWVFQGAGKTNRNVPNSGVDKVMIRRWVIPADPRTPSQIRQRNLFAQRVAEWHALSPEEKAFWNAESKRLRRWSGFNLFMSKREKAAKG